MQILTPHSTVAVKFEVSCLYQNLSGEKSLSFSASEISLLTNAKDDGSGSTRSCTPIKSIDFGNLLASNVNAPRKRKIQALSNTRAYEDSTVTPGGDVVATDGEDVVTVAD